MLAALIFLISILGYSLLYKALFPDFKPGLMLFTAFSTMVILSYFIIILCGLYIIGSYIIICSGLFLFVTAGMYILIMHREYIKSIISPSMVIFIIFYCLSIELVMNKTYSFHDEFSYWARSVKELWTFNTSYINADSMMAHKDYIPAFPALQFAIVRTFGWKDNYLYYVTIASIASNLSAITDTFSWKKSAYAFLFVILVMCVYPLSSSTYSPGSLFADGPLCLTFITGVLLSYNRKDNSLNSIFPVIVCAGLLPLLKIYTGFLFALIILVIFVKGFRRSNIDHIQNNDFNTPTFKKFLINNRFVLIIFAFVAFIQLSWIVYYNSNIHQSNEASAILRSQYLGINNPLAPLNTATANSSFLSNINTKAWLQEAKTSLIELLTIPVGGSSLSLVSAFLLIILGIIYIYTELKGTLKFQVRRALIALTSASFLYIAGTFIGMSTNRYSSSILRYMGIVFIPFAIFLFYYLTFLSSNGLHRSKRFLIASIALLTLTISPSYLYKVYTNSESYSNNINHANGVLSKVLPYTDKNDRIILVDNINDKPNNFSTTGLGFCYEYYALPTRLKAIYYPYGKDNNLKNISSDFYKNTLVQTRANKVVIFSDDTAYKEKFSSIFGIPINTPQPWIIDVSVENGLFHYKLEYH